MKKIFLTLLCIVSVAFNWSQINAENESEYNNSVINITIREKPDSNIKPHDETISVVSWYHNDTINFSFESYEGNAWFSITNINTGQKYTCSYSTLQHPISINIGNTSGIYQINIKTTIGSEYEGWLTL